MALQAVSDAVVSLLSQGRTLTGGKALTKQDFINKVAAKSGLSNRDAGKAVDAFMESVTETLKSGDSINFTGFGKFSPAARAARQGVNPRTGERVQIAATTVPKFSAGSQLKAALKS
ncbi:MAG TPA: HU family DNA-binding protein [Gaiellaceae bacterium]